MTEWRYSQLTFTEKKLCLQAMLLQQERMSEIHFPANWRLEFQKCFFCCPPLRYFVETVELSKL